MSAIEILRLMNDEDRVAVDAVRAALPDLARLVEATAERVRDGGRVHYVGAGTSGRLGVLDAAELRPTYSLPPDVVVAHIAGGAAALTEAIEDAEDSWQAGGRAAATVRPGDVAIGLTASGSTPYVGGALERARATGALTALIACNPQPRLAALADLLVVADTGPEVVAGSTRLKAGTAEKLALNSFSTALMVALGRTWRGLMVSVVATNAKLRGRTGRILAEAIGADADAAAALLARSDGDLKAAIVTGVADVDLPSARTALAAAEGSVARALDALGADDEHHRPIPHTDQERSR
jgi:N-acetylmuramic acid 6-phosphate etherase